MYDAKQLVQNKEGILLDKQLFVISGKHLKDEHTLSFYGIQDDSNLQMVFKLSGGETLPKSSYVASDFSGPCKLQFFQGTPSGRSALPSTNVKLEVCHSGRLLPTVQSGQTNFLAPSGHSVCRFGHM